MVVITLILTPEAAAAWRGPDPHRAPGLAPLLTAARALGVDLEPVHPGTDDPLLRPYFQAVAEDADAERVIARLRDEPAVEAAYVKPDAEAP